MTIHLKNGLQARPAALFVQQANRFHAHVTLEKNGKIANVKSIMGVMSLALACGEQFLLQAEGADEQEAVDVLAAFVEKDG
ncbi:MAG: HPr family phosphocarrier protein [Sporolactobacillus sp.]